MALDARTAGAGLAVAWEHLVAGVPEGWTQRARGAVGAVTGVPIPTLNGVWVYGEEAEREGVSDLIERVRSADLPHCLQFPPGCSVELRELAESRGMHREVDIPLMVLLGERAVPQLDHGDLVIELLDPAQAAIHAEVAAAGFQVPAEVFLGLMTPCVLGRPGVSTYVGKIDDNPVATAVGVRLGNHVGVFNVATLPAHCRHGYGAAMTSRVVRDGLAQGARGAWLQSTVDGYRVYEKVGFETLQSWECWIAA